MKKSLFLCLLSAILFISSCHYSDRDKLDELDYDKPFIQTLAWNNTIYEITDTEIDNDRIGKELGKPLRQVSPRPEKNGDVARNTSEGPSLLIEKSTINEIKNEDIESKIAIKPIDRYFECIKYAELE